MVNIGFTVLPDKFVGQPAEWAVDIFRRLLWAEADRVGVGRHLVSVPDCINVGDGGVDAYVDDVEPLCDDVIPEGSSAFQIKSADLTPKACRQELHVGGDLEEPLKDELDLRLQQGAAYVLVLFADITDKQTRARREAIEDELEKSGFPDTHVRVYTANLLAGFTNRHPSLVAVLRPELPGCIPYDVWSNSRDVRQPVTFVADSSRQELVDRIVETLRDRSECPVIRLSGLPGVGKTRTVFEALKSDDLRHQVMYVRQATDIFRTQLDYTLVSDPNVSAILVADDCDLDQHRRLADMLVDQGFRLALITMSYEVGRVPLPTLELRAEALEQETIESILEREHPGLPFGVGRRLAEFAGGYPRIAVLLAEQVEESTSGTYLSVTDDRLMNRLVGGSSSIDSAEFTKTKTVLMGISLFEQIGVAGERHVESRWLADRLGVTSQEFERVVAQQRDRGIVQGEFYVSVTPFMLRVHLMDEWWRAHGFQTDIAFTEFVSSMPDDERSDMLNRFFQHLPYLSAEHHGSEFIRRMLASDGPMSVYDLVNTEIGSRLFLALAEAEPAQALKAAQRVIGNKSPMELLEFLNGRRNMVVALERMAVWNELFQPAARLLLALGESETESWANNASGVFADLFSAGTGPVAPTEARPSRRLSILSEAISSESPERRRLGIRACGAALRTGAFHRVVGVEYQGVRREPELWTPATYGELFDAYRSAWQLLTNSLGHLCGDELESAVDVLLSSVRGLTRFEALASMVVETMLDLASDSRVDRREVIARAIEVLHYEGAKLPVETRNAWGRLSEELSGDDFSSRMERYVAMELLVDMFDVDMFDTDGSHVDNVQPHIEELADQAIEAPSLLKAEVPWLVTKIAKAGGRFGYELGARDLEATVLWSIVDAQGSAMEDADLSFLGGYLRALAMREPDLWEGTMEALAQEVDKSSWVVELTWRSGVLTKEASQRVLNLIQLGVVNPEELRIFRYGGAVRSLSSDDFEVWLNVLLEVDDLSTASTALDLVDMYYPRSNVPIPKDIALRVLCHPSWFQANAGMGRPADQIYSWVSVAEDLCRNHPDAGVELARVMLMHLGKEGTIVGGFEREPRQVLDLAMRQRPGEIWQLASSMLGPPVDIRAYHIGAWLRGSEAFDEEGSSHILETVPTDLIWAWVDEDPTIKAPYLANFVPKEMRGPDDERSLARELLVRHGSDQRVREELRANFSTEGWVGPESQHLSAKRSWLLGLREQETEPNVLNWIDEYSAEIDRRAEFVREFEERRGR